MNSMFIAIISLGGLGLIFGVILAVASKIFHVEVDPKIEKVRDALPGANCGACGFPGCDALAKEIVKGTSPPDACPVGGKEMIEKICEVLGVQGIEGIKMVARVICKGNYDNSERQYTYMGISDCRAGAMIQGGDKACAYGCLGNGSCVSICPFDAIEIVNGVAVINAEKCTSCGKCLSICPKNIIELVPYSQKVVVDCLNRDSGKEVKEKCKVGCIACKICEKSCPFDAVHVENNVAKIDYNKCTNCMICAQKCPTGSITANLKERKKAYIDVGKCIGCTVCSKNCPVEAIAGEKKEPHIVDIEKCIGCSICFHKCPVDAIEMK